MQRAETDHGAGFITNAARGGGKLTAGGAASVPAHARPAFSPATAHLVRPARPHRIHGLFSRVSHESRQLALAALLCCLPRQGRTIDLHLA